MYLNWQYCFQFVQFVPNKPDLTMAANPSWVAVKCQLRKEILK